MWQKFKDSFQAKLIAGIAGALLLGGAFFAQQIWAFGTMAVNGIRQIPAIQGQLEEVSMKTSELEVTYTEQMREIRKHLHEMSVVFGVAAKINCCPADEDPWARVNVNSEAFRWSEGDELRITKRGKNEITIKVTVSGNFRAASERYVLQMNKLAFQMLDAEDESEISVRVEEVE